MGIATGKEKRWWDKEGQIQGWTMWGLRKMVLVHCNNIPVNGTIITVDDPRFPGIFYMLVEGSSYLESKHCFL